MARTVRDARLENRTNRLRLKIGLRHFKVIQDGLALAYRRTGDGFGVWSVRLRQANGKYALERLGQADDVAEANDDTVLSFAQAQRKAQQRLAAVERAGGIIRSDPTVAEAATHYLEWFRSARKGVKETELTINAHILAALGERKLSALTAREIRQWQGKLASKPARKRSRIGQRVAYRPAPQTDDQKRARRSTANRVLTVLKAILNKAYADELVASRDAWTRVKPFENADQPVVRFLTEAEATRLLNASAADLRALVRAALLTGARYSELARMATADFNVETGSVFVQPSKSGKGRHIPLNAEGRAFFAAQTAGKAGATLIFTRAAGGAWGTNHHVRPLAESCEKAKIEPAITFHELRHTYASLLAQAGADLLTISKLLGHADTRITARHYAHLCDRTLANAVNALLPSFGAPHSSNVMALKPRRARMPKSAVAL
jgi:integrase